MSKGSSGSLFKGHPVAMLFGRFIDGKILEMITNEMKEIVSMSFGSMQFTKYSREVELVASLCYYVSSLATNGYTVGQLFCGLRPFPVTKGQDEKDYINRNASNRNYQHAAILYALLPYLYNRRTEILSAITSFWKILLEPEEVPESSETNIVNAESINQDNAEVGDGIDTSAESSADHQTILNNKNKRSILEIIITSLYRSYLLISHESSIRIERIVGYFSDIHQYLFATSSKFLDFPLRLTSLQLFSESLPPISSLQINISSFAWMLAARIILISYYACCVVANEIDMELLPVVDDAVKSSDENKNVVHGHLGNCPLCLSPISSPAALPCGHICCWECITTYVFNRPSVEARAGCKCPICRQAFEQQNIRALYFS